jgi:hypothetical protein
MRSAFEYAAFHVQGIPYVIRDDDFRLDAHDATRFAPIRLNGMAARPLMRIHADR